MISVLVAARDEERFIGEMLASVQRQDADLEVLVVDDRSVDATASVVAGVAAADPRVRLVDAVGVHGKNAAFNAAFAASSGDLVCYFGADDLMPPGSLRRRVEALSAVDGRAVRAAAFSKVRMFSDDPRFDGVVVPRGRRGSRSGGTTTLTRAMAEVVFPLDPSLPNEDQWTAQLVRLLAQHTVELPEVVVDYRIHAGNSFRRDVPFADADDALHRRGLVFERLLDSPRLALDPAQRRELEGLRRLEEQRHRGRTWRLLVSPAAGGPANRARLAAQSRPSLYAVRQRLYGLFSGW